MAGDVTRVISGKGVIVIPEEYRQCRKVYLYAQLVRPPRNQSINFTWNPDKSFYAHITFAQDDFVLYSYDMNFENQMWIVADLQPSQNLLSLICAYEGILDSFVNFAIALGIFISKTNLIFDHKYETFVPNRIRFECFADTAIKLTLKGVDFDICDPEEGEPSPPPPPPPPPDRKQPGEPVAVAPPYEGEDDGGDTVPFPIDEPGLFPGLPTGEECGAFKITFRVFGIPTAPPEGQVLEVDVWGVIESIAIVADPILPPPAQVCNVVCGGLTTVTCEQGQTVALAGGNSTDGFSVDIISILATGPF